MEGSLQEGYYKANEKIALLCTGVIYKKKTHNYINVSTYIYVGHIAQAYYSISAPEIITVYVVCVIDSNSAYCV